MGSKSQEIPGISRSRSATKSPGQFDRTEPSGERHHKLGTFEKSLDPALIACTVSRIVSGSSRSQTKSTGSSLIVRAGSAAGWVPVIKILIDLASAAGIHKKYVDLLFHLRHASVSSVYIGA